MPVNNDAREMPLISKENAEKYYDELLANYHYKTDYLYNKVPILKDHMENQILKEVTKIDEFKIHFPGEPMGQWQWLKNNMEDISNHKTSGYIPQDLVAGIEHLSKARNRAVHKQDMKPAGYLGHFCTVAETIEFFSKVPIPQEIQDILYLRNIKDNPDSVQKQDGKNVPVTVKNKLSPTKVSGLSFIKAKDDKDACLKKLIKDVGACDCEICLCSETRVLGNGCIPSKVMFIAQAPGHFPSGALLEEDPTGDNFRKLLKVINWERESIFITNAVLCHTSKEPTTKQIEKCKTYLDRLINLVDPVVIVTLGGSAIDAINKIAPTKIKPAKYKLKDIVAQSRDWNERTLFPLYLPTPDVIDKHRTMDEFKKDFNELKRIVDPITGLKQKE